MLCSLGIVSWWPPTFQSSGTHSAENTESRSFQEVRVRENRTRSSDSSGPRRRRSQDVSFEQGDSEGRCRADRIMEFLVTFAGRLSSRMGTMEHRCQEGPVEPRQCPPPLECGPCVCQPVICPLPPAHHDVPRSLSNAQDQGWLQAIFNNLCSGLLGAAVSVVCFRSRYGAVERPIGDVAVSPGRPVGGASRSPARREKPVLGGLTRLRALSGDPSLTPTGVDETPASL